MLVSGAWFREIVRPGKGASLLTFRQAVAGTDIAKEAMLALGGSRFTGFPAKEDEIMVQLSPLGLGEKGDEVLFDMIGGLGVGEAEAMCQTFDVGVYGDAFVDPEGIGENDIGGFSGDARQGNELTHCGRHLSLVFLDNPVCCCKKVFRFVVKKASAADGIFNGFQVGLRQGFGVGPALEKGWGNHIYPLVCTLGGQDGGYKQFPRGLPL